MLLDQVIVVKKVNEVFFHVDCSLSQGLELKGELSCKAIGYQWHPRYRNRSWNGEVYFFDVGRSLLPVGLLPNFIAFCKKFSYQYQLDFDLSDFSNNIL